MSTEKALDFGGSSRRLLRMLSPQRPLIVTALVMGVFSVALSVIGPKVLGNVTNLVFSGFISSKIPAGITKAQFVARLQATDPDNWPKIVKIDRDWLGANQDLILRRWAEWIAR